MGMQEASVVLPRRRPTVVPLASGRPFNRPVSSDHLHHAVSILTSPPFALHWAWAPGMVGAAARSAGPPSLPKRRGGSLKPRPMCGRPAGALQPELAEPSREPARALQVLQGGPSRRNLAEAPNHASLKDRGERIPPLQPPAPSLSSCRCPPSALPTQKPA